MEQAKLILPSRPKRSKQLEDKMENITLHTNLFPLSLSGKTEMHTYVLDIEPAIEQNARGLSDKIYRSAIEEIKKTFGQKVIKRGWNMWSTKKIDGLTSIKAEFQEIQYAIRFKWVNNIRLHDKESMEGTGNSVTMVLNNKVKKSMQQLGYIEIGRNSKFFDPQEINNFPVQGQGLNVWRGFKTSAILCPKGAFLLVDFSSRVLRQETALDFFMSENFKGDEDAAENMVGLSVMSYYGNHRIYRIDEVKLKMTPKSTFKTKDGNEISFLDYYKKQYNITIRDHKQPLLLHKDRKDGREFLLIPELMKMTGLTDQQRNNGKLMQAVAEHTKLSAHQRAEYIERHVRELTPNLRDEQDLDISKNAIQPGFALHAPNLTLGNKQTLQPQSGNFDLKQTPVLGAGSIQITNWVVIYESRGNRDDDDADRFVEDLQKASAVYGIKVNNPAGFITINNNKPDNWIRELKKDIKDNGNPSIVVSLIGRNDKNRLYKPLKDYLFAEAGVPHQNIVKDSLQKNRMSVLSKILLQMNAKLKNPLWLVENPKEVQKEVTMVIGIDMYHKLINNSQSCLGFVASLDPSFSKYYSRTILQKPGEEVCQSLSTLIRDALEKFFEYNNGKFLPKNIVIYRDGVGEGQLSSVIDMEIKAIKQGFKILDPTYDPKFAYIMINKKINTRYFVEENVKRGAGRGGKGAPKPGLLNPPSGTVLADNVTTSKFDFFLASQNVRQGTCTPTHYIVGHNSTTWSEQTFWLLTYYQCFNYYNWSGAVKVPAPVQYAHKLSYLVGETFKCNPHRALDDGPFYL